MSGDLINLSYPYLTAMKYILLLSALCLLFTSVPLEAQSDPVSADLTNAIDSLFAEYEGKPGAAIGVFRKGEVVLTKGYGLANLDYNIPVTTQTVFETGLASTTFTAGLILLLENQGKLQLDDPVQKFIPEFPVYPEGDITIRHLLLHTSGLRDYIRIFFAQGLSWNQDFDEDRALQLIMSQSGLSFAPGTQIQPGDSSYSLLASIVRRITGMSMGEFAEKELFGPLGMKNSFIYEDPGRIVPNRATGYEDEGEGYQVNHFYNFVGGGNRRVYSTVEDYFFWSENLKENKVGNDSFLPKMYERGRLADGTPLTTGLGLDHGNFMGQALVGYGGHWSGFASMYLKFPEIDLSVVVLSNNATISAAGKAYDLAALFLANPSETAVNETDSYPNNQRPETIELSNTALEAYIGDYFNYENGYVRKILLQEGKLVYNRLDAGESRLSPIGEHTFIMDNTPFQVLIDFRSNNQGQKAMYVTVEDGPESEYVLAETPDYTAAEWASLEGDYYCEDLDVTYTIKSENGQLDSYIGERPFLTWSPVMKGLFNEAHFGYLLFEKDDNGQVTTFTMNNALGVLRFNRI